MWMDSYRTWPSLTGPRTVVKYSYHEWREWKCKFGWRTVNRITNLGVEFVFIQGVSGLTTVKRPSDMVVRQVTQQTSLTTLVTQPPGRWGKQAGASRLYWQVSGWVHELRWLGRVHERASHGLYGSILCMETLGLTRRVNLLCKVKN